MEKGHVLLKAGVQNVIRLLLNGSKSINKVIVNIGKIRNLD